METASQPAAQTQESGYATLGDAYADSVFNQAGAVRNTDTVTRQGGGTPGNEPLTLSAQGQMPGYVGLSDDDDDEKKSSEPESPIIPVAGGLFLNTETGEYINNYVDNGVAEAGQESGGSNDYYIDPDDYENPEDYAKAMVIGSRNSMKNGDNDAFLAANKYPTGAEGLFALNKDVEETLGELGFAVFTDELNQQDAANNAANGQAAGAGAQGYNYGTGMNDGGVEYPPEPSPEPMPQPPPVPNDHPDLEDYEAEAGKYWDEHDAWEDEVESIDKVKEDASVVYISESDYNKQLTELERKLELRQGFVDSYETKMLSTSLTDANYNLYMNGANRNRDEVAVLEKAITELREQRAASAKTDPLFNTTGIISNQNSLGNMPYGSQGTAAGNSCGAVAAHNALVLLGENSDFADVYTYFNDDSKLNLGGLAGGKLGTNPLAVAEYLENEGHEVMIKDFKTEELENPGTYILVYVWQGESGNISAHFKTAESDGSMIKTYNSDKTYFIGNTNNSGDNNAKNIEELKNNSDMLETEKSWLLNGITGPLIPSIMQLTNDDTYFSYIIKID